ncbi:MAG TPA: hypothetical protein VMT78_07455 [Terriglobia bacterium]|nr:hypothetical protein [Terriglobia bacterium]
MEHGRLKAHIEAEEESLKDNFEEIQDRVKDALNWRVWYRNNTALALGGIAAGGLVLSLLIPKSSSIESKFVNAGEIDDAETGPSRRESLRSEIPSRMRQVLDNTANAVLGVATDKLRDFMSNAIPGFREHYSSAQRKRFD